LHQATQASVHARACKRLRAQVTMKLQLVYEEPYAGYPDAELVKSPSPVPRTVRGGVDLSVFNSGSAPIKARARARQAACLRAHALRCCCRACGVAARCRTGRKARCRSERAARSGWSRAVPAAQVPWTLTIVMPPNEKFVTVFNARLTDTSADGVSTMSVSDEWQTLQANRVNAADVSFLVDASSQVRTCVAAGWRRQWGSRTGRNARCMWACCEACCAVWGCP